MENLIFNRMYSAPGIVRRANTGAGWMDIQEPDAQGSQFDVSHRPYEGGNPVHVGSAKSREEAEELANKERQNCTAPEAP